MRVIAIIPAFNEASHVGDVVSRTRPFVDQVVVVDDGSTDGTGEAARLAGALVVRHVINRGLGAALGTGFAAARQLGADAAVTLDADGQHEPEEIPKFVEALQRGAGLVIGSRMLKKRGTWNVERGTEGRSTIYGPRSTTMPWYRIVANTLGNLVTLFLFGAWVTDSQSGFRALSREALASVNVQTNRMEVSSEIVAEAQRHRLRIAEVPIKAIYTDYSLSKGQGLAVGLKTLVKLIVRRMVG